MSTIETVESTELNDRSVAEGQTESEVRALLALNRVTGVGPVTIRKIIERYASAEAFFRNKGFNRPEFRLSTAAIESCYQYGVDGLNSTLGRLVGKDLDWLSSNENHVVTLHDNIYPQNLKVIPNSPALLYISGNPELLGQPQLGIVGSRNATASGLGIAESFAYDLSQNGLGITSGLALGIDASAHRGALRASSMATIAVVGRGLDQVYPRQNTRLAYEIIESGGAMISEFPIGTKPQAQNFPRRNRVISALSLGVLVVEATLKSGSLITAQYAVDQGKEVFAVPGSIHSPQSKGTHQLIRQGSKLVDSSRDILEELPILPFMQLGNFDVEQGLFNKGVSAGKNLDRNSGAGSDAGSVKTTDAIDEPKTTNSSSADGMVTDPLPEGLTEDEQTICRLLYDQAKPIDELVALSGLTARHVMTLMTVLEIKGLVESVAGGFCRR